jgi:hypothetical protein
MELPVEERVSLGRADAQWISRLPCENNGHAPARASYLSQAVGKSL